MLKLYLFIFSIILFLSGSCGDIKYGDKIIPQNNTFDSKLEKFSCEDMLEKTPKSTIIESYKQCGYLAIGSIILTSVTNFLTDNNSQKVTMLLTTLTVTGLCLLNKYKSLEENKLINLKKREDLLEEKTPPYYQIVDIYTANKDFIRKEKFKKGDYIVLIIRSKGLNFEPNSAIYAKYFLKLYKDNIYLGEFYDTIYLPQGEAVDVLYIPVCEDTVPGKYKLEFTAISNGEVNSKQIYWEVINE